MRLLWLLLFLCFTAVVSANDTLTFRRIYDYQVGDIFDYQHTVANELMNRYSSTFNRVQVTAKHYSTNLDTVFYNFSGIEQGYTNLDSPAVFTVPYDSLACSLNFNDTGFPGIVSNSVYCYPSVTRYSEHLGKTFDGQEGYYDGTHYMADFTRLIYYNNGVDSFGTPYNIAMHLQSQDDFLTDFQLLRNDGSGYLLINTTVQIHFILSSIGGDVMKTGTINPGSSILDLPELACGLYLLTVTKGQQHRTFNIPVTR